jgi:hypothetical protein
MQHTSTLLSTISSYSRISIQYLLDVVKDINSNHFEFIEFNLVFLLYICTVIRCYFIDEKKN